MSKLAPTAQRIAIAIASILLIAGCASGGGSAPETAAAAAANRAVGIGVLGVQVSATGSYSYTALLTAPAVESKPPNRYILPPTTTEAWPDIGFGKGAFGVHRGTAPAAEASRANIPVRKARQVVPVRVRRAPRSMLNVIVGESSAGLQKGL